MGLRCWQNVLLLYVRVRVGNRHCIICCDHLSAFRSLNLVVQQWMRSLKTSHYILPSWSVLPLERHITVSRLPCFQILLCVFKGSLHLLACSCGPTAHCHLHHLLCPCASFNAFHHIYLMVFIRISLHVHHIRLWAYSPPPFASLALSVAISLHLLACSGP